MSLIDHPTGDYRFLPGIAPYSCGVVSRPGFQIIHAVFGRPVAYRAGMAQIAEFLGKEGRPQAALCGVELRSKEPYTFEGFANFNAEYAEILKSWGVFVDGVNPVARTNIAPVLFAPSEPVVYGFSFTKACSADFAPTFVVAGAGELPEGKLSREDVIAVGDVSAKALATKSRFVMDLMESRLKGLGVGWPMASTVDVYTAHSITPLLPEILIGRIGASSIHGILWHYSRPPVQEIEFEMDVRGVRTELRLA